jgi:hypothetical protein
MASLKELRRRSRHQEHAADFKAMEMVAALRVK